MNSTARIQAWATLVAVLILPVLYVGGVHDAEVVSWIGLGVFTISMLTCPLLRLSLGRTRATAEVSANRRAGAGDVPHRAS